HGPKKLRRCTNYTNPRPRATQTPATAKLRASLPTIPNYQSLVFHPGAVSSVASPFTAESMVGAHLNGFATKTAGWHGTQPSVSQRPRWSRQLLPLYPTNRHKTHERTLLKILIGMTDKALSFQNDWKLRFIEMGAVV